MTCRPAPTQADRAELERHLDQALDHLLAASLAVQFHYPDTELAGSVERSLRLVESTVRRLTGTGLEGPTS